MNKSSCLLPIAFMASSRLENLFILYINYSYNAKEEEDLMGLLKEQENEVAVQTLIENVIKNTYSEIQMTDQNSDFI